jgi:hypothetical protein
LVLLSFVAHHVGRLRSAERPTAVAFTAILSAFAVAYLYMILERIAEGGSTFEGGPLLEAAITLYALTIRSPRSPW